MSKWVLFKVLFKKYVGYIDIGLTETIMYLIHPSIVLFYYTTPCQKWVKNQLQSQLFKTSCFVVKVEKSIMIRDISCTFDTVNECFLWPVWKHDR